MSDSMRFFKPREEIVDTTLVQDDDDPMFDEDGYTAMTPEFGPDDMLEALEEPDADESQSELPPQEAYETMKFQAPLSSEEEVALDETPFLTADPNSGFSNSPGGQALAWVDDPDHNEWLMQRMHERHSAMDEVLEDEMYGDTMTPEEKMDLAGSEKDFEVGWRPKLKKPSFKGLKKLVTKPAKFVAKAPGAAWKGTKYAGKKVKKGALKIASIKKYIPSRDAKKAKLIKNVNAKLVREHANWLQARDIKQGVKKPRSSYENTSKIWAKNKLTKAGLPTSYSSGNEISETVLGGAVCGAWWWPFSRIKKQATYVLVDSEGERLQELTSAEYQGYKGGRLAAGQRAPGMGPPGSDTEDEQAQPEGEEAEEETSEAEESDESGKYTFVTVGDSDEIVIVGDDYSFIVGDDYSFIVGDDSEGAADERLIEATGDADARTEGDDDLGRWGRRGGRGGGIFRGGRGGGRRGGRGWRRRFGRAVAQAHAAQQPPPPEPMPPPPPMEAYPGGGYPPPQDDGGPDDYAGDGWSEGALEERLIDASGNADARLSDLGRGKRRKRRRQRRDKRAASRPARIAAAEPIKQQIKGQLPSGSVSKQLVIDFAIARSGQQHGRHRRRWAKQMRNAIRRRGATIDPNKNPDGSITSEAEAVTAAQTGMRGF